jgi:DnaJ-like protein
VSGWLRLALILAVLVAAAAIWVRLPPRRALAALVLAAAAGLAALRMFALAVPAAALGVGLWRSGGGTGPSPGRTSEVATAALRMTLDHDSGAMDGEVLAGPFEGARLSDLSAEDLQRLLEAFETAGDEDSLSLLLAYLDRRHGGRAEEPPRAPMTEAEAYRILGLAPGASLEEVRAAYRRLIRRVHPDLGGSGPLAAMINAAKELLDPG